MLVPLIVKAFHPRHDAVPSSLLVTKPTSTNGPAPHFTCLSTCTLQVSQVSCAVPVSVFGCPGLFGSTDPLISHVTFVVLQEFCVSPAIVPVTVGAVAPAARLAIVLGLTVTALLVPLGLPLAGHPASVKFVSVTVQFWRSAVPVFCTVIVTALLPLVSRNAQFFVTVSPGVWHWKLAVSFAVATKLGFLSAVQKQLSVAVSGSPALSAVLHVVFTGTGLDIPPCATFPMLTAELLIAVLLSATVQLKRPVPPVFLAAYCTVSGSAAMLVPFTVNAF